jgi:hypothetical protein
MPPKGQHATMIMSNYGGGFTFAAKRARVSWTTSSKGTKKQKQKCTKTTTKREMWVEIVAGWISKLEGHVTQCKVCVCVCVCLGECASPS